MSYNQINSIPTPLLCWGFSVAVPQVEDASVVGYDFVNMGSLTVESSEISDSGDCSFSLSFLAYYPAAISTDSDAAQSSFALKNIVVTDLPETESISDSAQTGFSLASIIVFSQVNSSAADSAQTLLSLKSV